jgi:hypothetical protein
MRSAGGLRSAPPAGTARLPDREAHRAIPWAAVAWSRDAAPQASGTRWRRRSSLAVPLALGPGPHRGGPLPLLACPVGVAQLLVQRRQPLVQASRRLVGNDASALVGWVPSAGPDGSGTPATTSRATSTTYRRRDRATLRSRSNAVAASSSSRSISVPLACSITTRCCKATCSWRVRRPWV